MLTDNEQVFLTYLEDKLGNTGSGDICFLASDFLTLGMDASSILSAKQSLVSKGVICIQPTANGLMRVSVNGSVALGMAA